MNVPAIPMLIENSLVTAVFSYPFAAGWVDAPDVTLVERVAARMVREQRAVALLDSVAAQTLLDTHVIVRDVAVSARHASFVSLATHARPDMVDNVTIAHPGVAPATLAIAQITIPAFYGIIAVDWSDDDLPINPSFASIADGAKALVPLDPIGEEHAGDVGESTEGIFQEDLGRAWHLLTNVPFVSHVCVAPRDALTSNPAAVLTAVEQLLAARELAKQRGRELRRDLSRAYAVEREVLTETLAEQTYELGEAELAGLIELWTRAGLVAKGMSLRSSLVRLRKNS